MLLLFDISHQEFQLADLHSIAKHSTAQHGTTQHVVM
jgi:hypothetical protein